MLDSLRLPVMPPPAPWTPNPVTVTLSPSHWHWHHDTIPSRDASFQTARFKGTIQIDAKAHRCLSSRYLWALRSAPAGPGDSAAAAAAANSESRSDGGRGA